MRWRDIWVPLSPEEESAFLIDVLRVLIVVMINVCVIGIVGIVR